MAGSPSPNPTEPGASMRTLVLAGLGLFALFVVIGFGLLMLALR